jgi:hypothetical protein
MERGIRDRARSGRTRLFEKQNRQAEYDHLTALPRGSGLGEMSGSAVIAHADDAATKLAR